MTLTVRFLNFLPGQTGQTWQWLSKWRDPNFCTFLFLSQLTYIFLLFHLTLRYLSPFYTIPLKEGLPLLKSKTRLDTNQVLYNNILLYLFPAINFPRFKEKISWFKWVDSVFTKWSSIVLSFWFKLKSTCNTSGGFSVLAVRYKQGNNLFYWLYWLNWKD